MRADENPARESLWADLENLPTDWRLSPIDDVLIEVQYGLNTRSDSSGQTAIVGMKDINNGTVDVSQLARTSITEAEKVRYLLRPGDILLNRTNSYDLVGKVAILDADIKAVFASYLVRLKVNTEIIDPWFLNQWLNHSIAQRVLKTIATRAVSQSNINPSQFRKYCPVPIPPLSEQHKIVELLGTWDRALFSLSALIELKAELNLALSNRLIRWIGREYLPLRRLLSPILRAIPRPKVPYRALSIKSHGKGTLQRMVGDPDSIAMNQLFRVETGDLIVNITFAWEGAIALVSASDAGSLVSHRFPTFIIDSNLVNPRFFRHLVRTNRFIHMLGMVSPGGAGRNRVLNKKDFLSLEIPLPERHEQDLVAAALDSAEAELEQLYVYRSKIAAQKRGLMQNLLTGKMRLTAQATATRVSA
jgi:type I restriction enzyme, S subunit